MRNDKLFTAILILQALIIAGLWNGQGGAAQAKTDMPLPDPGARQLQMVDELKNLNAKFDRLTSVLQSGEIVVKVKADEAKK